MIVLRTRSKDSLNFCCRGKRRTKVELEGGFVEKIGKKYTTIDGRWTLAGEREELDLAKLEFEFLYKNEGGCRRSNWYKISSM